MKILLSALLLASVGFINVQGQSDVFSKACYAPGEAFDCRLNTKDGSLATWTFTDNNGEQRVFTNAAVVYPAFDKPSVNTFTVVTANGNSDNGVVRCSKTRCH